MIYNEENRGVFKDRILKSPSDANVKALLNSDYNRDNIHLLEEKYNQSITDDVMKAILKHHWKTEDYKSPAHEKIMKLQYYNGVVSFIKREIARYFKSIGFGDE